MDPAIKLVRARLGLAIVLGRGGGIGRCRSRRRGYAVSRLVFVLGDGDGVRSLVVAVGGGVAVCAAVARFHGHRRVHRWCVVAAAQRAATLTVHENRAVHELRDRRDTVGVG